MNWQHLRAFLWLRWRLASNQWRRAGAFNAVLMTIVAVFLLVMAVPLGMTSFALGLFLFPRFEPAHLLYVWDGVVVAFLLFWGIGVMADMQRSESLALSKFLHLPVAVSGAFVINFVSSLLSLTLVLFIPIMFGLSTALVFAKGQLLLLTLPLTVSFLLMITALTYQFQGWLEALISNPRRRRTVIVGVSAIVVMIIQVPNLINIYRPWGSRQSEQSQAHQDELIGLRKRFEAKEFDAAELVRRQNELIAAHQEALAKGDMESGQKWERTVRRLNMVLPFGWLPLGVMAAAEGSAVPALAGTLAMTLVGAGSLWRAYRTTVRLYRGQFSVARRAPAVKAATGKVRAGGLLETRLPGVSEPVSVIALAGMRSLIRSPEAKMMLLFPLMMGAVFASVVLKLPRDMPEMVRPLIGIGAIAFALFGLQQLMANQFGFDRDGFRVFVLCAASRRDILLGKNLAYSPFVLGLALAVLLATQVFCPMRLFHLLAMAPQLISMFLLYCIVSNLMSVYTPTALAAGSLKPVRPKMATVLLQLFMFGVLFPMTQLLTLLPLGIEALLDWLGWTAGIPIYLLLATAQCAAVVWFYLLALQWHGSLLQSREQQILEVVTNRAP